MVLVAGDVYDRAVPPVDAVELCEDALLRLHATGARIVLISGNHDSARRLGFGGGLLDKAGVHLRTRPARWPARCCSADAHGPVAVYGIPYLEPDAVRDELPPDPETRNNPRKPARRAARRGVLGHAVALHPGRRRCPRHAPPGGHGPRLGDRGSGQRIRARHHRRRGRPGARRAVRRASATPRSATCTASRPWPRTCATAARRCPTRSPRPPTTRAAGWSSWTATGTAQAERVPAPGYRQLSVLRGRLADLLGVGRLRPRTRATSCPSR